MFKIKAVWSSISEGNHYFEETGVLQVTLIYG